MKKLLVFLLFLCSVNIMAQDVIVKKDGSTIVCRVEKVSETDVTYKLWSDLKGSSYVMDKSLISAINYENGKKDTFSETVSLYKPNNQNDGVQAMNDKALLKMDWAANNPYKKVKRLKTWGWIGGGLLAAGGIVCIALSPYEYWNGWHFDNGKFVDDGNSTYYDGFLLGGGIAGIVIGAGVTTICLVKANKEKKKIDAALQTSSIYRYDIPFSNGSSLSVSADMLNDRIMNKRTVGLGLSYNF